MKLSELLNRVVPPLKEGSPVETRVEIDGQPVPFDWKGGGFHWKAGNRMVLKGDTLHWTSYTLFDGCVVTNWETTLRRVDDAWQWSGSDTVNCFALGWMPMDEEYLYTYCKEMLE